VTFSQPVIIVTMIALVAYGGFKRWNSRLPTVLVLVSWRLFPFPSMPTRDTRNLRISLRHAHLVSAPYIVAKAIIERWSSGSRS